MEIQELRLLDCILDDKTWDLFSENNILDSDFVSKGGKKALKFIRNYIGEYGDFPPKDVVSQEESLVFPDIAPRDFVVKNYKKFRKGSQAKKLIERARDALNKKGDPDLAISVMKEAANIQEVTSNKSYRKSGEERIEDAKQSSIHGLSGIVPPWDSLRKAIEVWENSSFDFSHPSRSL